MSNAKKYHAMDDGKGIKSSFNLAQLSQHFLYFIYERKFYVRTHGKITRQWKSTLRQLSFDPLFGLYASQGSLLFSDYSFPEGSFGFLERDYSLPEGGITPDKVLRSAHGKDLQLH